MSSAEEFQLIKRYFAPLGERQSSWLVQGIGDDCALFRPPAGMDIAVSTDTLLPGVHFPQRSSPADIARRALLVNLSDLAACAAAPRSFCLALSLPQAEPAWLEEFSGSLAKTADEMQIVLAGGDLVRGPLAVTIQVIGVVPTGCALTRSGAQPGDRLWISGATGQAAAGLALIEQRLRVDDRAVALGVRNKFWSPEPRLQLAIALRGVASAAIDISDGLLADAGHLATASKVLISIDSKALPLVEELYESAGRQQLSDWALTGGDDYELCFSAPVQHDRLLQQRGCIAIGRVTAAGDSGSGVLCDGQPVTTAGGWNHFADD